MVDLVYDDDFYEIRRAEIVDTVEWLESQSDPAADAEAIQFELGLSKEDICIILRLRERFPHWREERFVPPTKVQKALIIDGRYGEEAQQRYFGDATQ